MSDIHDVLHEWDRRNDTENGSDAPVDVAEVTTLRDKLVEAVADSYIDTHNQGLALVDDYAEAALDAILDTLEANAKTWDDQADMLDRVPWPPRGMTLEEAESMHSTKAVWLIEALRRAT